VIVAAITTLLSATCAFADTSISSNNVQTPGFFHTQLAKVNGGFKSHLDSLVTAGTITQAQEDAVQTAMMPKKGAFQGHKNGFKTALDSLVTAGTITQAQEDAITTALTPKKGAFQKGQNGGFKTALDSLVTAGTITQAQETAILGS